MSRPLGFNDSYALGMKDETATRLGIRMISDLRQHPELKIAFTNEFLNRADGWPGLRDRYGLPQENVRGVEHALAYRGLESGAVDVIDLYSTDPEIRYYNLRVLEDDQHYFPAYYAVLLYRTDLKERGAAAVKALLELEGRIPRTAMVDMNARAKPASGERVQENRLAGEFLADNPFFQPGETVLTPVQRSDDSRIRIILALTGQHLFLVAPSLAAAILFAVPLGIWAARQPAVGRQSIPPAAARAAGPSTRFCSIARVVSSGTRHSTCR